MNKNTLGVQRCRSTPRSQTQIKRSWARLRTAQLEKHSSKWKAVRKKTKHWIMNRFQDGSCSLFFFCCRRMKRWSDSLLRLRPRLLGCSQRRRGVGEGGAGGGVYRALDACIHVPVGSICVRARWQRKYMEINASSCSPCTSNAALLSGASALRQASSREKGWDQRLMRQPSHKRTQQTHEYWYDFRSGGGFRSPKVMEGAAGKALSGLSGLRCSQSVCSCSFKSVHMSQFLHTRSNMLANASVIIRPRGFSSSASSKNLRHRDLSM